MKADADAVREAAAPWARLAGVAVSGYEIHHGQTQQHAAMEAADSTRCRVAGRPGLGNTAGNVMGLYLHGLFEDPAALQALFGAHWPARCPRSTPCLTAWPIFVETHFAPGVLQSLLT